MIKASNWYLHPSDLDRSDTDYTFKYKNYNIR